MSDMDILNWLVSEAGRIRASDIHIRSGESPKMRVDGSIVDVGAPLLDDATIRSLAAQLRQEHSCRATDWGARELDLAIEASGRRCRLHVFEDARGAAVVVRLLPAEVPTFASLSLPECVASAARAARGLVLVTGPAGAGKSSTLAAIVDDINSSRAAHIITLEDPIEVVHRPKRALITQREVYRHSQSFASALRAALRQDPDVLLVGEMRDLETVELALTAAETGHLVLGTLHAGGAAQTVSRLVDVFPAAKQQQVRSTLAESLSAVVSQQLLPKAGGGRLPAVEVLVATSAMRSLIREGKTHQIPGVMQASLSAGMVTMEQSLRVLRQALGTPPPNLL